MRSTLRTPALAAVVVLVGACAGAGGLAAGPGGSAAAPAARGTPAAAPAARGTPAAMPTARVEAPPATPAPARTPRDVTPSSIPIATPGPTPSPWPRTDGEGAEVVGGRDLLLGLTRPYTNKRVGDVGQVRGGQITVTSEMNDPRVDGTATFDFSIDSYGRAGLEWGTMRLENEGGAWEGPCSGGTWAQGEGVAWSCWLTGSGAYDGWAYYRQLSKDPFDSIMRATGIVVPGEVPAP